MKCNNYFTISELCIDDGDIPIEVANKLLKWHILPMNKVRECIGAPVCASSNSGYRSYEWEISRGRSGGSQHVFRDKGAVDWTAEDLRILFKVILMHTDYTRIAVYPKGEGYFLHCDYNADERQIFLSDTNSVWKLSSKEEALAKLK